MIREGRCGQSPIQAIEREDERGSEDLDRPDVRTHRPQPAGEAVAGPRHETVEQQDVRDVADEQCNREGQRGASRQIGSVRVAILLFLPSAIGPQADLAFEVRRYLDASPLLPGQREVLVLEGVGEADVIRIL